MICTTLNRLIPCPVAKYSDPIRLLHNISLAIVIDLFVSDNCARDVCELDAAISDEMCEKCHLIVKSLSA
jgi:hypothetical protein